MKPDLEESIYEIDLNKKYAIVTDTMISVEKYEEIKKRVDKWMESDEPFLFLFGFQLKKIDDLP